MTLSAAQSLLNSLHAQAAYAGPFSANPLPALVEPRTGEFTPAQALRFLGTAGSPNTEILHQASDFNGFSATALRSPIDGRISLAIRGTNDTLDFIQDAKLGLVGFASDQAISLYRYY